MHLRFMHVMCLPTTLPPLWLMSGILYFIWIPVDSSFSQSRDFEDVPRVCELWESCYKHSPLGVWCVCVCVNTDLPMFKSASEWISRNRIAVCMVNICLTLWGTAQCVPDGLCPFTALPVMHESSVCCASFVVSDTVWIFKKF